MPETLEQVQSQLTTEIGDVKARWYIDRAITAYQLSMSFISTSGDSNRITMEGTQSELSQDESRTS